MSKKIVIALGGNALGSTLHEQAPPQDSTPLSGCGAMSQA